MTIQKIIPVIIVASAILLLDGILICPFRKMTSLLCPFCHTTSSLGLLLEGKFGQAIQLNPLAYLLLIVVIGSWFDQRWSISELVQWPMNKRGLLILVLTLAFWIWRNVK